jgi:hypothetical protein
MNYSFNEYLEFLTEAQTNKEEISEEDKKLFKDSGFNFKPVDKNFTYPVGKIKDVGTFKIVGDVADKMYYLEFVLTNSDNKEVIVSKDKFFSPNLPPKKLIDSYVEGCLDIYSGIEQLKSIK